MTQEKISVIVPVYNVAPYLRKCIDSLLAQTYTNLEIILIDDGSTDGSEQICDEYAECHSDIIVIHQKNSGLSVARNVGLETASGEWIAFLDSDDWVESTMYETLFSLVHDYEADLASCSTRQISINGEVLSLSNTGNIHILTPDEIIMGLVKQEIVRFEVWNKLWKRSLIGDVRFIAGQVSEDVHFDRLLFLKTNKMVHIDLPLHNYLFRRPGSTACSFKLARLCIFNEFDELIQELDKKGKIKLADSVRWVALNFAYNIYSEAVDTKQDTEIKGKLLRWFKQYYCERTDKTAPVARNRIKMRLFYIFPTLLTILRKFKRTFCQTR